MPQPDLMEERLRALGTRARLAQQDEAWEAVALGGRAEHEVALERAQAGDLAEEIEQARAMYRPFGEREQAALVDVLLVTVSQADTPGRADPEQDDAWLLDDASPPRTGPGDVRPTEAKPRAANDLRYLWIAGLAAVAALVVWQVWPSPPKPEEGPSSEQIATAAMPAYRLDSDGGLRSQRGDDGGPPAGVPLHYGPETRLEWAMRPLARVEGEVEVRVFAHREGSSEAILLALEGVVEIRDGAVRIAGPASVLGLSPGAWNIAIVMGRPGMLPSDPAVVRTADRTDAWLVERLRIVLEP